MQCPGCGCVLQAWESQCPRCASAQPAGPAAQPSIHRPFQPPAWHQTLHTYSSASGPALAAVVLLGLTVLVEGASILSDLAQASMLQAAAAGRQITDAEATVNDARQSLVALAGFGMLIVTAVVWCVWKHRAHQNTAALGARGQQFSPGWAVGYYFVPVLHLWRPFQAMGEIWRASDPAVENVRGTEWQHGEVPGLLRGWWAAWIAAGILGNVAAGMAGGGPSPQRALTCTWIGIVGSLVGIAAAVLAIVVVRTLTHRQERAYARLAHLAQGPPQALPQTTGP